MVIATALIQFDPATTEEMLQAAAKVEAASRTEPGCLRSTIARSVSNETELLAVQIFDTMETFEAHAAATKNDPTYKRWQELVTGFDGTVYEGESVDISHLVEA
jgi:quinol monooxygenase YgiN